MAKIAPDASSVWIAFKSWGSWPLFYPLGRNSAISRFPASDKEVFEAFAKVFVENEIYAGIDSTVGMGWHKKWKGQRYGPAEKLLVGKRSRQRHHVNWKPTNCKNKHDCDNHLYHSDVLTLNANLWHVFPKSLPPLQNANNEGVQGGHQKERNDVHEDKSGHRLVLVHPEVLFPVIYPKTLTMMPPVLLYLNCFILDKIRRHQERCKQPQWNHSQFNLPLRTTISRKHILQWWTKFLGTLV